MIYYIVEMSVQRALKAPTILIFVSLLCAGCGELDTVLPAADTYQIKALVNNISLDECSLVSSSDRIQPYFASSVSGDPDVTGLMVYLENSQGQILGEKLVYSLNPDDIKEQAAETKTAQTKSGGTETAADKTDKNTNGTVQDNTAPDDTATEVKAETAKTETAKTEAAKTETAKTETAKTETAKTETTKTETTKTETAKAEAAKTEAAKAADSQEQEAAEKTAAAPANSSDASGKQNETPASIETSASSEIPVVAANEEKIIFVKRLDRDLPSFSLPKNLAMGQYTLVFRIVSRTENIQQIKKALYYLGSARFSLKDIKIHLPGAATGSQLVPLGATVMLKANLDFDPKLDPYIVWYNGKKIISEGRLSDGAEILLWKAPDQNGFHSLRAEAFPFNSSRQKISGSSRDISLPVSSKAAKGLVLAEDNPNLLRWYQFDGTLKDAKEPNSANASLVAEAKQTPRWTPAGNSYGLASGSGEAWLFPAVSFGAASEDTVGQIVFRFMPCGDGGLFSVVFESESAAGLPAVAGGAAALALNVSLKEKTINLSLEVPDSPPLRSSKNLPDTGAFVTAALEFNFQNSHFEARLIPDYQIQQTAVEANAPTDDTLGIGKAVLLNGKYRIVLGTPPEKIADTKPIAAAKAPPSVAVWNEMALLHIKQALPETKTAEDDAQITVQTVAAAEPEKPAKTQLSETRSAPEAADVFRSVVAEDAVPEKAAAETQETSDVPGDASDAVQADVSAGIPESSTETSSKKKDTLEQKSVVIPPPPPNHQESTVVLETDESPL